MRARRQLAAIPRSPGRLPRVRIAAAAPAAQLRQFYAVAQRRFGVHWSVLAAINFVESAFGRVRSASEAGARGPMQFLPSTWRIYGMGGDIDDPHDAILAAANYLRRSGAARSYDRAVFAYNHSMHYVRAVRRFASRMRRDDRTFLTYYAWQVYVRTAKGGRRVTGPGLELIPNPRGRGGIWNRSSRLAPQQSWEGPMTVAWDRVSRSDVLRAIQEYDRLGPERFYSEHGFAPTTTYELVLDERRYPPKAILGTAYEFAAGERLASGDFEGGKTGAVRVLEKLGFTIQKK